MKNDGKCGMTGQWTYTVVSFLCATGLTSCNDDGGNKAYKRPANAAAEERAEVQKKDKCDSVAAQNAELSQAEAMQAENEKVLRASEDEILEYMIYRVGGEMCRYAATPRWYGTVRDMRSRLLRYYRTLKKHGGDRRRVVRVGRLLADATRALTSYDRAEALYDEVLHDWKALSEADRRLPRYRRIRNAVANGKGACLLAQRKYNEALPLYEEALRLDRMLYRDLMPKDTDELPTGENVSSDLRRAAEDVVSSYRCLGDAQLLAGDPEQARETYSAGQAEVMRMQKLFPGLTLQYIRLLTALGNLENKVGHPQQALGVWKTAANLTDRLLASDLRTEQNQQAVFFRGELHSAIEELSAGLREKQNSATEQGQDNGADNNSASEVDEEGATQP